MGKEKAGFLTPKAIANRIKAKGLQKLRWFCQMCQKQCRDENGFKCHLTSESHQRQLLLFAENPDKYVDEFSQEFLDEFLNLLKRRFGTKRVSVNVVYQEYISYREHVHMNSTQWETLTEFAKWLGREGHCVVDETEKGWFIAYIDRDPEALKRQEALQKKEKMELDDQERTNRFIQQQVEKAAITGRAVRDAEYTALQRQDEEEKVTFSLGTAVKKDDKAHKSSTSTSALVAPSKKRSLDDSAGIKSSASSASSSSSGSKKHKSALDEIMELEEKKREKSNRKDHWLHEGIVVKVITKRLGEKYNKKKGVVKEVKDIYAGVIKMLDSGDKIKVDQTHLETVIPGFGKPVLVVNGAYRGTEATLVTLDEKAFSCSVKITSGPLNGRVVEGVRYEDVCKLHT